MHNIKKKTDEFMALGRTEFHKNLEKWQDFFEETSDDFYEMETRLEKLEP